MRKLRVGSLVYATESGLGILAHEFYLAGVVTDPLIIEHAHHETHYSWYPSCTPRFPIRGFRAERIPFTDIRGLDAMLFFETPFDWQILEVCRTLKIKTILMPMYECMPKHLPSKPDLIICPSLLDHKYYPEGKYLPVPSNSVIQWHLRKEAKVFVHNAGHGGLRGRNGTAELLEAVKLVKSDARFIIRSQKPLRINRNEYKNCTFQYGTTPHSELYEEGDVFVFPEKFNGLSLPLQEAYASGMLVIASSRFPNNEYLPNEPLIPVKGYTDTNISARLNDFKEAVIDPRDIAETIDEWYGKDITMYSEFGRQYAETNSWSSQKPLYMDLIERAVCG